MKPTGTSTQVSNNYNLNNDITGKFQNKNVKKSRKQQHINLHDTSENFIKKPKKLLSRNISHLIKSHKKYTTQNKIENKNLSNIYRKCMSSKDNLEINKMLGKFLQTLDKEYSEKKLPSKSQKKILYKAYLNMSAHYLSVKSIKNSINPLTNSTNIKSNIKEFCNLVYCNMETNSFLKNSINNPTYVSAQMQQLVGKGCFTAQENNFIYEKCLSIHNRPEPKQIIAKLQKKRFTILTKDNLSDKENKLKEIDNSIENINLQLEYIKQEKLVTQKTFVTNVFNKRSEITNKKLNKMIISYINTLPKSNRNNAETITANIINIIKEEMQNMINSGDVKSESDNTMHDIIYEKVKLILNQPHESEC